MNSTKEYKDIKKVKEIENLIFEKNETQRLLGECC